MTVTQELSSYCETKQNFELKNNLTIFAKRAHHELNVTIMDAILIEWQFMCQNKNNRTHMNISNLYHLYNCMFIIEE